MLTREGVLERDCFVIELARKHECPAVVTLGGGYSDDAWRSSTDFIRWLLIDDAEGHGGAQDQRVRAIRADRAGARSAGASAPERGVGADRGRPHGRPGRPAIQVDADSRLLLPARHRVRAGEVRAGGRGPGLGFTDPGVDGRPERSGATTPHAAREEGRCGSTCWSTKSPTRDAPRPEGLEPPDEIRCSTSSG